MASNISFSGITSGVNTDALVNAIIAQESVPMQRMQIRQARDAQRISALTALRTSLNTLAISLVNLGGAAFDARSVASNDTGSYVSATATNAAVGTYDIQVTRVATKGRLSATLDGGGAPTNLAVADAAATSIFSGTSASFAIKGTDGVIKTLTLGSSQNNLNSLRDAINATSGLGVTASVVNTGTGANPHQLVLTAKETGTGSTSGLVTLADVTDGGAVNSLGITAGTVDSLTTPTTLTGGLQSGTAAQDALFTLNGVSLTRKSNTVTDAVSGITFTLKQGSQTSTTSLTVDYDRSGILSAFQDVVSKYNGILAAYKQGTQDQVDANGKALKDVLGKPVPGVFANDSSVRDYLARVRTALAASAAGISGSATYQAAADVGLKTNGDGSLSLDSTAFTNALTANPEAVRKVFGVTGTSTNTAVSFTQGLPQTTTGDIAFNITSYTAGGAVSGTLTVGGTDYTLSGTNGVLSGGYGTPLEGLVLAVTGTGSGTLTVSRGMAAGTRNTITGLTKSVSGTLPASILRIQQQDQTLSDQIYLAQKRLDRRKAALQAQFSQMESALASLRTATQSLSSLG